MRVICIESPRLFLIVKVKGQNIHISRSRMLVDLSALKVAKMFLDSAGQGRIRINHFDGK